MNNKKGFTLIELLLVIGIIAILAAIVIVAINPTKQLGESRDAQRRSDVNTILNAVYQYSIDNNGDLSGLGIPDDVAGADEVGTTSGTHLCPLMDGTTSYIVSLPVDPSLSATVSCDDATDAPPVGADWDTGYTIVQSATSGRITVEAIAPEQATSISVTR
jgi:type IV pilus assembly protein PilA